jgi:hypothetical protein
MRYSAWPQQHHAIGAHERLIGIVAGKQYTDEKACFPVFSFRVFAELVLMAVDDTGY